VKGALIVVCIAVGALAQGDEAWLTWSAARAQGVGNAARVQGRVGGFFDTRILSTNTSYNYKLAGTWLNPEVIQASARMAQLTDALSVQETKRLVAEAQTPDETVVMVEVDPREGSGVIPNDWVATLQPVSTQGQVGSGSRGRLDQKLRENRALAGTGKRNYDYDRFWVVFPLRQEAGVTLLQPDTVQLELVVHIAGKEGRVRWPVSATTKAMLLKPTQGGIDDKAH
jgi:hypothetical protein